LKREKSISNKIEDEKKRFKEENEQLEEKTKQMKGI